MNITIKDWLLIAIILTLGLAYIAKADEPRELHSQIILHHD